MSPNTNPFLNDIRRTLLTEITKVDNSCLEATFIAWVCPTLRNTVNAQLPTDWSSLDYHHVAQLGFMAQMYPDVLSDRYDDLAGGLTRMLGRTSIVIGGSRAPFATDVIALIGLATGAKVIGGSVLASMTEWLISFIQDTCKDLVSWKRCIACATIQMLSPNHVCSIVPVGDNSVVGIALNQIGIGQIFEEIDDQTIYNNLLKDVIEETEQDPCLAALRYRALYYILDSSPTISLNKPSVADLIHFLERIPAAFRRWTWEEKPKTSTSTIQNWDIQNEYHVQNLLYLLLSPVFRDLEDEFYLEPIGQKNARADLGIPSLSLIIEVKFLRSTVRFADMIEEIAADNSLYFASNSEYVNRYQHLLAFVWDDSRRDTEHDVFKRGVSRLNRVVGSIVISRPGNMQQRP